MKFTIQRETLLKPLQTIATVVERRQTLPVLSNILMVVKANRLAMTATDLEVEMAAALTLNGADEGDVTIPARKIVDICRALPEGVDIDFDVDLEKNRAVVKSGKSRFALATLSAAEFPSVEDVNRIYEFAIPQAIFKRLIDKTLFAMAQQDVRYYLNGLLLEISNGTIRTVATDGHRLALCDHEADVAPGETIQVILPRKGVVELSRLLEETEEPVTVTVGNNHIRITLPEYTFTSKLIDGRFPDYDRVIPKGSDKHVVADRNSLRQALVRTSILSNEKYRGIRLRLENGTIQAQANNPEMEEAEETIDVQYEGASLEIGFNVSYLLDALGAIDSGDVNLALGDSNSSCVISPSDTTDCTYVIMPMRL
jgi:DNA polymerase-3 subunit beta